MIACAFLLTALQAIDTVNNLMDLISFRHEKEAIAILREHPNLATAQNAAGQNVINVAAARSPRVLRAILLHDPKLVNLQAVGGYPPLCWASMDHQFESVRMLLNACGDPNLAGDDGRSAMHFASDPKILEALIARGGDVKKPDSHGWPPVYVSRADASCIEVLVKHGADINGRLPNGQTLATTFYELPEVHFGRPFALPKEGLAAFYRRMQKLGLNVDAPNKGGMTALMYCVARGDEKTVRALLQLGADRSIRRKDGMTALDIAKELNRTAIQKLLEHRSLAAEDGASPPDAIGKVEEILIKAGAVLDKGYPDPPIDTSRLTSLLLKAPALTKAQITDMVSDLEHAGYYRNSGVIGAFLLYCARCLSLNYLDPKYGQFYRDGVAIFFGPVGTGAEWPWIRVRGHDVIAPTRRHLTGGGVIVSLSGFWLSIQEAMAKS